MFSQFLSDVRIYSGEEVPLNVISIGKPSIFPHSWRKCENSSKETHEYKEWGNAFNDTSYMRKHGNSLDAKPVSGLILEDLAVIAVFVDLWELIRGKPLEYNQYEDASPLHWVTQNKLGMKIVSIMSI